MRFYSCGRTQKNTCKCGGEGWRPDAKGTRWCSNSQQWVGRGNLPTKSIAAILAVQWSDLGQEK